MKKEEKPFMKKEEIPFILIGAVFVMYYL